MSIVSWRGGAVLLGCLLYPLIAGAADWPQWRGTKSDGISHETGWSKKWPEEGLKVSWKTEVGTGFSSVTVSQGHVYTVGNVNNTDTIYCLEERSGKEVWKYSYSAPLDPNLFEGGPTATPALEGNRLFMLSRPGRALCLDSRTGKVIWETNVAEETGARVPSWGFGGSPVLVGETVVLNVGDGGLALRAVDGSVLWKSGKGAAGYTTPVITSHGGKVVAVMASDKWYYAVEVASGELVWRHRWLTRYGINASDPLLMGDKAFISTGYRKGAVHLDVSAKDPVVLWKNKNLATQFNPAVLVDGHLYGINGDSTGPGSLRCVNVKTGDLVWENKSVGFGSVSVADDHLIVLTEKGSLMVAPVSSSEFRSVASMSLPAGKYWTVPVLSNGAIYCRNASGVVVRLNLPEGS